MDVAEVLLTGLDRFAGVLDQAGSVSWDRPSPCAGWDARAVAGHVITVLDSAATVMRGGDFDWSQVGDPREVAGDDPVAAFRQRAADARAALQGADLDHATQTPIGTLTVGQRLSFAAMDLHLHAWDLGRTIGVDVEIPEGVVAFVHAVIDPLPAEMSRSEGVFGPEVAAPADATTTEALMAWTGRQPRQVW